MSGAFFWIWSTTGASASYIRRDIGSTLSSPSTSGPAGVCWKCGYQWRSSVVSSSHH
ncbi:hypothetical protein ACGF8B_36845 [Streptomyces sp. NPDC047917]|uniref:hypothetical protein n=1 Tax=Streptomyces sp. NPDC047917 TaxID=3365491 RepID=UPI00371C7D7C